MRELLLQVGKCFGTNKWNIVFANASETLGFECEEGFLHTIPYPGTILDEERIKKMIHFLQQTLMEKENHEQSNVE